MSASENPLIGPPPDEVPLKSAPLVRVLAQLRFPEVLSIESSEFVAPFQEAIRGRYPVLRQDQTQGVLIGPSGLEPAGNRVAWRFSDADGTWRVSLTREFVAIETTNYVSRADFVGRLKIVAEALLQHVQPSQLDRFGLRYIDRITGEAVGDIGNLVRPEIYGIAGSPIGERAMHSISETMFDLSTARLLARWGLLPPNATVDSAAIEPTAEQSWILDLDMFSVSPAPFTLDNVTATAQQYAERIYAMFRWVVTKDFLTRYGGTP